VRVPASTYRLQVTPSEDLFAAARRLPYLHDLGVDWVYLSPVLRSEPGSTHGYDVVDHAVVDPARGGREGLVALSTEARRLGMGVLVDVVPNHMGIATPRQNAWWWDVLRHGPSSSYADAFDIDWSAHDGRLLVPVVGDDDEASVTVDADAGVVRYHEHTFPLAPGTTRPDEQHYDLVSWRRGDAELNYRRFFSITTLAGLRVEEPRVLAESHAEIRSWFDEGLVDGLRIDHPDGLRDPASYLEALRDLTGGAYVVVEKILALHDASAPGGAPRLEELPPTWATAGTTGYDVLGLVDRVLTDPAGEAPLTALESRLRGRPGSWPDLVHDRKRAVADTTLAAEVARVVREVLGGGGVVTGAGAPSSTTDPTPVVEEVASPGGAPVVEEVAAEVARVVREVLGGGGVVTGARAPSSTTDPTPVVEEVALRPSRDHDLVDAVAEVLACFPTYRSYLPDGRDDLTRALAEAQRRRPDRMLTLEALEPLLADPARPAALRFQQTSGAVMAKGVEDNAFYRWGRLTSLTEVGGEPGLFAMTVADFHAAMAERQRRRPHALTATTTHDTKRSEDVRARIAVLAELPDLWTRTLDGLLALAPLPEPAFGNVLWQAVAGAWPAGRERLHAFAEKAMREAGERTSWTEVDAGFEHTVHAAVDAAYDDPAVASLLEDLVDRIAGPGWSNALAAKLLALTVPGVPDVYQGTELWTLTLVDPDNRRPVEWSERRAVLDRVLAGERPVLTPDPGDHGHAKLLVTQLALTLRRLRPELFATYDAVAAEGTAADHVLAFDRGGALTVVTRLPAGLAAHGWGDTALLLPDGAWADLLTGRSHRGRVALTSVLTDYPVALLVREAA